MKVGVVRYFRTFCCLLLIYCSYFSRVIPNCVMKAKSERRRPFVGDQLEDCRDASGLFYILPFQKVRYLSCCVELH
jgi:actin-related protein 6